MLITLNIVMAGLIVVSLVGLLAWSIKADQEANDRFFEAKATPTPPEEHPHRHAIRARRATPAGSRSVTRS